MSKQYNAKKMKGKSTGSFDYPHLKREPSIIEHAIEQSNGDWPYETHYSNATSAISGLSVETPGTLVLQQVHTELVSLIESCRKRRATCTVEMRRIRTVRQKLTDDPDTPDSSASLQEDNQTMRGGSIQSDEKIELASATQVSGEQLDANSLGDNNSGPAFSNVKPDLSGAQSPRNILTESQASKDNIELKSDPAEPEIFPIAALELFEYSIKGIPQHDEEYLKKKFGVATYPSSDLTDLLPGDIPNQDFTRAKPSNQVQFSTFTAAIEPFFKPLGEEDVSFLKQKAVGGDSQYGRPGLLSPFAIPPLGPNYVDVWLEEDGANPGYSLATSRPILYSSTANGSEELINDSLLEGGSVSCGPLASRLLSALLPENFSDSLDPFPRTSINDNELRQSTIVDSSWRTSAVKVDFGSLEDRIRKEFRYVGIIDMAVPAHDKQLKVSDTKGDDENDWAYEREDDEICLELRMLQKKLRSSVKVNQACKRALLPLVQEQLAYQEYSTILEDLDKQMDQAYCKRFRNPKTKKKKGIATSSTVHSNITDKPAIKLLMDKRQRWIEKVGSIFSSAQAMKRVPKSTVFSNLTFEDEDEELEEML